jgi:hypothetical protein
MNHRILKYSLEITDRQTLRIPGFLLRPVLVGEQAGILCLWVAVPQDAPVNDHEIIIVGTGHVFDPEGLSFLGSVQMSNGLVWHVFCR